MINFQILIEGLLVTLLVLGVFFYNKSKKEEKISCTTYPSTN